MTEHKLKPCPFCNGKNSMVDDDPECNPLQYKNIYCEDCGATGPTGIKAEDAIKSWNTRVSGWISVENALPEKDGRYYVFGKKGETEVLQYINNLEDFIYGYKDIDEVTYWQPLPEPPEEK